MGLLDRKNEDVSITRKMANGSSVTYKSPNGSQMDMQGILGKMSDGYAEGGKVENYQAGGMLQGNAPSPVADNKQINVTPGEFVVNQPAAQKYKGLLEQINNEGKQMLSQGGWTDPNKGMAFGGTGGYDAAPIDYRVAQEARADREQDADDPLGNATVMWVDRLGIPGTDHGFESVEATLTEWASLSPSEQAQAGSLEAFIRFAATEEGLLGGDYQQDFWTGGEVGKGNPEEGDTPPSVPGGQGISFKDGNWVYSKSGKPVQSYLIKRIADAVTPMVVQGEEEAVSEAAPVAPTVAPVVEEAAPVVEKEAPKLNATEGKNHGWALRAIAAEKIIRELENDPEFRQSGLDQWKQDKLSPNSDIGRSEKGQRYRRAVEAFAQPILRKDTGATISAEEFDRVQTAFFPGFGTGKAATQDVRNQRMQAIGSFISSSGPASGELKSLLTSSLGDPKAEYDKDKSTVSWEEGGGLAGGLAGAGTGAALGSALGPLGTAGGAIIGGALGAYAGRASGQVADQWANGQDIDLGDALTPDKADFIDIAIAGAGGGVGNAGKILWKGVPIATGALKSLVGAGKGKITAEALDTAAKSVARKAARPATGGLLGRSATGAGKSAVGGASAVQTSGLLGPDGSAWR